MADKSKRTRPYIPEDGGVQGWTPFPNALSRDVRLLTGTDLKVYIGLLYYTNQNRKAWPAVATIAKHVGLATRSVQRALRRLTEKKWIQAEIRFDQTTLYTLVCDGWNPQKAQRVSPESPPDSTVTGDIAMSP